MDVLHNGLESHVFRHRKGWFPALRWLNYAYPISETVFEGHHIVVHVKVLWNRGHAMKIGTSIVSQGDDNDGTFALRLLLTTDTWWGPSTVQQWA